MTTAKPMTAAEKILDYLDLNRGTSFSNPMIARALNMPQDSVRRVVNELRRQYRVIESVYTRREWTIA